MRALPRPGTVVALVGAAAVALSLAAGPASAVPAQTLDPVEVPRGADPAIPHLDGTTIVDGTTRIPVSAPSLALLGKAGTGYVVVSTRKNGTRGRLVRVESSGATLDLGRALPYGSRLSSDGQVVMTQRPRSSMTTTVKLRSAITGATLGRRTFEGYPEPLDAQLTDSGVRAVVSGYDLPGTRVWDTATGSVTRLTRRIGEVADLRLDLMSGYTKDPYQGGCTVVSRISNPGVRLWRSCDDSVVAFSPDGSHLAAINIFADGIGPQTVSVRSLAGAEVGAYKTTRNGYFGRLYFEGPTALLLDITSKRRTATIRCVATTCDRASEVTPSTTGGEVN